LLLEERWLAAVLLLLDPAAAAFTEARCENALPWWTGVILLLKHEESISLPPHKLLTSFAVVPSQPSRE
jgi:hypothetical protein